MTSHPLLSMLKTPKQLAFQTDFQAISESQEVAVIKCDTVSHNPSVTSFISEEGER